MNKLPKVGLRDALAKRLIAGFAALALSACAPTPSNAAGSAPDTLTIATSTVQSSTRVVLADSEAQQVMTGAHTVVAKPVQPTGRASRVEVRASSADGVGDALTLQWKDAANASLRFEWLEPVDLRPFLADGALEFDLQTVDMAHGGLIFATGCGAHCSRELSWVVPSRALAGKGWQHLSIALRCFAHDGDDFSAVTQAFALESSGTGEAAIANLRVVRHGMANVACPDYRTESITPRPLEQVWSLDWWIPRHEQKLAQIAALRAAHLEPQVVFIGDSITHGWEKAGSTVWQANYATYHALNLGFSGDRTENVLWRLQHGELDGIHPQVVVMMIGTNNTGERQEAATTTAAGIRRLLDEVRQRQPAARILLLAVFPRGAQPDSAFRRTNDRVNSIIAGFADDRTIHFLDLDGALTNPDGSLSSYVMPDLLHPGVKGYALWAEHMAPTLQRLLDMSPPRR